MPWEAEEDLARSEALRPMQEDLETVQEEQDEEEKAANVDSASPLLNTVLIV